MRALKALTVLTVAASVILGAGTVMAADAADYKVGFITLHDENSTYDLNFINAAKIGRAHV